MLRVNNQEIVPTIFPDGTSQVWKLSPELLNADIFAVDWFFENEAEFFWLIQLLTLRRVAGAPWGQILLNIRYLPYARQDKKVNNNATFAGLLFIKILDTVCQDLNVQVKVLDPHNPSVIPEKWEKIYPRQQVTDAFLEVGADVVCFPDKGAEIKYRNIYSSVPYVIAHKERNQLTGEIIKTTINGDVIDKVVLIVDDICDGGATFIHLARLLLTNGAKEVNLFVTHGLFTKGKNVLHEAGINKIFTGY